MKPLNPITRIAWTFALACLSVLFGWLLFNSEGAESLIIGDIEQLKQYTLIQLYFIGIIVSMVTILILNTRVFER